jgi:hypothetical protein
MKEDMRKEENIGICKGRITAKYRYLRAKYKDIQGIPEQLHQAFQSTSRTWSLGPSQG